MFTFFLLSSSEATLPPSEPYVLCKLSSRVATFMMPLIFRKAETHEASSYETDFDRPPRKEDFLEREKASVEDLRRMVKGFDYRIDARNVARAIADCGRRTSFAFLC